MAKNEPTPEDFLMAHTLLNDIFITGMFYPGITIYNQQIRTLNLVYFLIEKGKIDSPRNINHPIVILGGGVAGIMAALAFRKKSYNVVLLEEQSILLHLQHGCSIRKIHPNLLVWPRSNSLKKYTELPFANWEANDAAGVEKQLKKEFNRIIDSEKSGSMEIVYNVAKARIDHDKKKITFSNATKENTSYRQYSYLILATGFGLEEYVGRKEKTKSYWRNEDLAQLRFSDQIKKYIVSGVGDGGISDVCRLALTAYDPIEWAKKIEAIEKGNLINELRGVYEKHKDKDDITYYEDFEMIFTNFEKPIRDLLYSEKREDITRIILNGKDKFENIIKQQKMSFLNAWSIYLINKCFDENYFKYHEGAFPSDCGEFLFPKNESDEYYVVIRHGTDKNWDRFKALNEKFEGLSKPLEEKQAKKSYNDFSTSPKWPLSFWQQKLEGKYSALTLPIATEMTNFFSGYLSALEGIINNYIKNTHKKKVNYRATIHRLISFSDNFFFQQVCNYIGDRKELSISVGRGFPIEEGIVGMAMRTNTSYSLVKKEEKTGGELLEYNRVFARPLSPKIHSFLVIAVPFNNQNSAGLCLYIDTYEKELLEKEELRILLYASLTSFIKEIDERNNNGIEISDKIMTESDKKEQVLELSNIPGVKVYNDELKSYWDRQILISKANKFIDIYDE